MKAFALTSKAADLVHTSAMVGQGIRAISIYLDDIGPVQTIDAVDPERDLLLTNDAVGIDPGVPHVTQNVLHAGDQTGHVLETHPSTMGRKMTMLLLLSTLSTIYHEVTLFD